MRAAALAALALSAGACCLDGEVSCVVERAPASPYCMALRDDDVCWPDDVRADDAVDPRECPGTLHDGGDCGNLGFTVRCWDYFYVRPGDPC